MEKYHWTLEEIDKQFFWETLELETGDWKKKVEEQRKDPVMFIDDLGF